MCVEVRGCVSFEVVYFELEFGEFVCEVIGCFVIGVVCFEVFEVYVVEVV